MLTLTAEESAELADIRKDRAIGVVGSAPGGTRRRCVYPIFGSGLAFASVGRAIEAARAGEVSSARVGRVLSHESLIEQVLLWKGMRAPAWGGDPHMAVAWCDDGLPAALEVRTAVLRGGDGDWSAVLQDGSEISPRVFDSPLGAVPGEWIFVGDESVCTERREMNPEPLPGDLRFEWADGSATHWVLVPPEKGSPSAGTFMPLQVHGPRRYLRGLGEVQWVGLSSGEDAESPVVLTRAQVKDAIAGTTSDASRNEIMHRVSVHFRFRELVEAGMPLDRACALKYGIHFAQEDVSALVLHDYTESFSGRSASVSHANASSAPADAPIF